MAGASTGTADRRLTLGKRTNYRKALKAKTMDARGIELFGSRRSECACQTAESTPIR